jgi:hypothetical protein
MAPPRSALATSPSVPITRRDSTPLPRWTAATGPCRAIPDRSARRSVEACAKASAGRNEPNTATPPRCEWFPCTLKVLRAWSRPAVAVVVAVVAADSDSDSAARRRSRSMAPIVTSRVVSGNLASRARSQDPSARIVPRRHDLHVADIAHRVAASSRNDAMVHTASSGRTRQGMDRGEP